MWMRAIARAGECTVGGFFVLALLILAIVRVGPALARLRRSARAAAGEDRAAALLAIAVSGLPPEHGEWGAAMSAELAALHGVRPRAVFAASCLRAALVLRLRAGLAATGLGGGGVRALVLTAVAAVLALGIYGAVRYPALRAGVAGWAAIGVFAAILLLYAAAALALTRGASREAGSRSATRSRRRPRGGCRVARDRHAGDVLEEPHGAAARRGESGGAAASGSAMRLFENVSGMTIASHAAPTARPPATPCRRARPASRSPRGAQGSGA